MLTTKGHNVTASNPVVAAVTTAEAAVFWNKTPTAIAKIYTTATVTVTGTTNSSAYVYCMV